MLTKQSTQLLNQLESLVYNANPEILMYCKDETPQWVLTLLTAIPRLCGYPRPKLTRWAASPIYQWIALTTGGSR